MQGRSLAKIVLLASIPVFTKLVKKIPSRE